MQATGDKWDHWPLIMEGPKTGCSVTSRPSLTPWIAPEHSTHAGKRLSTEGCIGDLRSLRINQRPGNTPDECGPNKSL
jgi:hypothetical protein